MKQQTCALTSEETVVLISLRKIVWWKSSRPVLAGLALAIPCGWHRCWAMLSPFTRALCCSCPGSCSCSLCPRGQALLLTRCPCPCCQTPHCPRPGQLHCSGPVIPSQKPGSAQDAVTEPVSDLSLALPCLLSLYCLDSWLA